MNDDALVTLKLGDIVGPCGNIEAKGMAASANAQYSGTHSVVIICHPHPLHGGTMSNKVVTTLARAYRDLGIGVVCFNFRGVGESAGVFDHAVGEVDDLLSVISWVKNKISNVRLLLAGFSFGSSIAAQGSYRTNNIQHLLLVAPPVTRYKFDEKRQFSMPVCIIQGVEDEQVLELDVSTWKQALNGSVIYFKLAGAGHFFHGVLPTLKARTEESLIVQYPVSSAGTVQ